MRTGLFWRVFASYLLILTLSLFVLVAIAWTGLHRGALGRELARLESVAREEARLAEGLLAAGEGARLADFPVLRRSQGIDVQAVDTAARPVDASVTAPGTRVLRPEVERALGGEVASRRASGGQFVAAAPVPYRDSIAGAVIVSRDAGPFLAAGRADLRTLLGAALLAWVAGAALAYTVARRFSRPVEELRRGAERFGRGELKRRVALPHSPELAELADALNRMALQLDARINEITSQRNEREAILESMQEGVLAIDRTERILSLNRQAEEFLGVSVRRARGRLVQEAFRNPELQKFLRIALSGDQGDGEPAVIRGQEDRMLQLKSAPLFDSDGQLDGTVVVLADVTRLRQLENLRREFVANVSHELRTPITSIKGFAETLLDDGCGDTASVRRFVEIIARQADRLHDVIEDLLALSRLDREHQLEMENCDVQSVIIESVNLCRPQADERSTAITCQCPPVLGATVNPRLLEQALTNLIDNAIKYSPPGSTVEVRAEPEGDGIGITVRDNGPGIPGEHLPRLFERFYRVDKARSRDVGGTGLGLSIVKHVAQAHGGEVTVESRPGEGSAFHIHLPGAVEHAARNGTGVLAES